MAHRLIKKLKPKQYDVIVTCGRGGMMASQFLAYAMDIKSVIVLTNARQTPPFIGDTQKILFVDDINDTSKTIELVKQNFKLNQFDVAVMYQRYSAPYKAQYVGEVVDHDEWLEFTWDKKEYKCIE